MADTVRAIWRGPFVADRGPGLPPLHPGEEADVLPLEAVSEHWEPVGRKDAAAVKAAAAANATPDATPAEVAEATAETSTGSDS